MTIFAPLTGMLWRTLEAYGIDPRRVIKEEIYQPDGAFRMGARIPYSTYNQILEKAIGLINDHCWPQISGVPAPFTPWCPGTCLVGQFNTKNGNCKGAAFQQNV